MGSSKPGTTQQSARFLNFIGGEFLAASSGKTFENRSPVDGRLLGLVSEAGEAEVDAALSGALMSDLSRSIRGSLVRALQRDLRARRI
jgi:acyl-CoA reductase-like NAD-dependent aldehyde dehydrogenase